MGLKFERVVKWEYAEADIHVHTLDALHSKSILQRSSQRLSSPSSHVLYTEERSAPASASATAYVCPRVGPSLRRTRDRALSHAQHCIVCV